jgi:hypothetical protein
MERMPQGGKPAREKVGRFSFSAYRLLRDLDFTALEVQAVDSLNRDDLALLSFSIDPFGAPTTQIVVVHATCDLASFDVLLISMSFSL